MSKLVKVSTTAEKIGTSLQGYIDCTYESLVELFGQPRQTDGYKVDAEWVLVRKSDGAVITIYNYKTGKNYLGANGQETKDITDWHIGGKDASVVKTVHLATGLSCRSGW